MFRPLLIFHQLQFFAQLLCFLGELFVFLVNYLPFWSTILSFWSTICLFGSTICLFGQLFGLVGQLFGLVGDTGDASLDGVEVAEVAALERRDGVLVRDNLKVVVELVHQGHACIVRCRVHAKESEITRVRE